MKLIFTFKHCLSGACTTWRVLEDFFQGIALAILEPLTLKFKLIRDIKVCDTLDVAHLGSEGFCSKYRSSFKLLMTPYNFLNIKDSITVKKCFLKLLIKAFF
jgi:hypothetical protein